jgi:CheY-like chemotaxis protein
MMARPFRILIADDNDDMCEILRCSFEAIGFEVAEAHDGNELVARCRAASRAGSSNGADSQTLDLVIADIFMPRLSGLEALQEIREFAPDLPFILMTAALDPDLDTVSKRLAASHVCHKPIDLPALVALGRALASAPIVARPSHAEIALEANRR